jgi:hypothetical protein
MASEADESNGALWPMRPMVYQGPPRPIDDKSYGVRGLVICRGHKRPASFLDAHVIVEPRPLMHDVEPRPLEHATSSNCSRTSTSSSRRSCMAPSAKNDPRPWLCLPHAATRVFGHAIPHRSQIGRGHKSAIALVVGHATNDVA